MCKSVINALATLHEQVVADGARQSILQPVSSHHSNEPWHFAGKVARISEILGLVSLGSGVLLHPTGLAAMLKVLAQTLSRLKFDVHGPRRGGH